MILRQIFDAETSTYTYIIGSEQTKRAVIIDPVVDMAERYVSYLKELDLTLEYSLDTHTHADHITALGKLRELTGAQSLMGEQAVAECTSGKFTDGQEIELDDETRITCLYTPGHTDDSYCFLLQHAEGQAVFTGDCLLIRGCGRTDFQNGDAEQQYQSVTDILFKLAPDTVVYPGHDYKGMTQSSIAEEQRWNPRFSGKTLEEFKQIMANLNLDSPKMMDVAVPANQACGRTPFGAGN